MFSLNIGLIEPDSGTVPHTYSSAKQRNERETNLEPTRENTAISHQDCNAQPLRKMKKLYEELHDSQKVVKEVTKSCRGEPPKINEGSIGGKKETLGIDVDSPLEEIPAEARGLFLAFLKKMGLKVVKDDAADTTDASANSMEVQESAKNRKVKAQVKY